MKSTNEKSKSIKEINGFCIDARVVFGKGSFGKVYKSYAQDQPEKTLACKVLRKADINDDEYCLASFKQEIEILKRIKSKNLIKLKAIR